MFNPPRKLSAFFRPARATGSVFLLCALLAAPALTAGDAHSAARLRRFNDCKFGMFIHWGPYSLASVEASWPIMRPGKWGISETDYRQLPRRFNPVQFDARAWVRLAKAAGQRYMVFTSKHHDGFCMFDSAYTDYKITNTPYKKDIAAQLAAAAREEKMPLGFYYSPPDMNHPGFRDTAKPSSESWGGEPTRPEWALYLDYMEMQVRELLLRYGDIFVVWFDGLRDQDKYDGYRFHKLIREIQPQALINNRIGLPGDYSTPEQHAPEGIPTRASLIRGTLKSNEGVVREPPKPEDFQPWETCLTINRTWAYNRNDTQYKSVTQLIHTLVDVASKGGNLLLNVGPTPEGTIQPEAEERLRAIGAWLNTNGESIYGSTYGPLQNLPFGRTTAKGAAVYLHVFDWPNGELEVKGLRKKVARAALLVEGVAGGRPLKHRQQGGVLRIEAPAQAPDPHVSVIRLETR